MINKYIVVCPNCGTKLITVCSNAASDTYCPQCYQQLPSELYTKERNNDEALEIIANNESLSEGFAETVVNQMANDDEAPHNPERFLLKSRGIELPVSAFRVRDMFVSMIFGM